MLIFNILDLFHNFLAQSFYFLNTNNADDTDKYKNNFVSSATFGFKSNQNKSQVGISSLQ